jgi:hypothetical protein
MISRPKIHWRMSACQFGRIYLALHENEYLAPDVADIAGRHVKSIAWAVVVDDWTTVKRHRCGEKNLF